MHRILGACDIFGSFPQTDSVCCRQTSSEILSKDTLTVSVALQHLAYLCFAFYPDVEQW